MKIKQVFCKSTKELMSIKEVSEHQDHEVIKNNLICATLGCNARISFVSGSGGRRDHFRKVRFEEHSSDCHMQSEKAELKEKKRIAGQIAVSLSEKAIARRVRYFFKKRRGENKRKDPKKNPPLKRSDSNTQTILKSKTTLGSTDDPSLDSVKKNRRASAPQIPTRTLNQISATDEGNFIQLSATVEQVIKKKNSFELILSDRYNSATLVITEAFIKGSRDIQISDYLTSLIKFTDENEDIGYKVSVFVFCMFEKYKKNETIIYANNFDQFYLSISGKRPLPIKLDTFQALLSRGSWK